MLDIDTIKKVLEYANEVGPLPEWTQTDDGAMDVLRRIEDDEPYKPKLSSKQFNIRMSELFKEFGPIWTVDEDHDGQIIIHTGLKIDNDHATDTDFNYIELLPS